MSFDDLSLGIVDYFEVVKEPEEVFMQSQLGMHHSETVVVLVQSGQTTVLAGELRVRNSDPFHPGCWVPGLNLLLGEF